MATCTRNHLRPTGVSLRRVPGSFTAIRYGVFLSFCAFSLESLFVTGGHSLEVDQRNKDLRYGLKLTCSCNYMHFSLHLASGYRHVTNRQVHDTTPYIFTNYLSRRKILLQQKSVTENTEKRRAVTRLERPDVNG